MKRLIGFVLLIFVFLFGFSLVSGQAIPCVSQDDIILKLAPTPSTGNSNAHGAIYSETDPDYTKDICYSTIFGQNPPSPFNRACVGNNIVVRLEAPTNAHGQIPSVNTYTTNICYPQLSCTSISSGNCVLPAREVISLESPDNAHLGVAGSYANKICCSLSGSPPTGSNAAITAPQHRGVYFTAPNEPGLDVNFKADCSGLASPTYSWSIKQNGQTISVPGSNSQQFSYHFAQAGQVDVILTCTSGSVVAKDEKSMLVVTGNEKAFAYIDTPLFNSITPPPSSPQFQTEVFFKAKDSFVVGVTGANGCTVTCIAGYCPLLTNSSLNTCASPAPNFGSVLINGAPSQSQSSVTQTSWNLINFDWTFRGDDGWTYNGQATSPGVTLDGSGESEGYVYYNTKSNAINDKHIDVTTTYPVGGSATATSTFTRDFTLGRCLNNGGIFLDNNNIGQSTSSVSGACKGADGAPTTADDCCPSRHVCTAQGSNYFCQPQNTQGTITKCSDFNITNFPSGGSTSAQSACTGNTNPAIPQNSWGAPLGQCESVECYWITSGANVNTCGVKRKQFSQDNGNQNGLCTNINTPTSTCDYSITQSECINGRRTITYNDPSTGQPYPSTNTQCFITPNPINRACGDLNFELGFFDYWQFFASALVVAFIYLALGLRKHEK